MMRRGPPAQSTRLAQSDEGERGFVGQLKHARQSEKARCSSRVFPTEISEATERGPPPSSLAKRTRAQMSRGVAAWTRAPCAAAFCCGLHTPQYSRRIRHSQHPTARTRQPAKLPPPPAVGRGEAAVRTLP